MDKDKMADFNPSLSLYTIAQAVDGDKAAIKEVVKAYEPYISAQSTVRYIDDDGKVMEQIDEDISQSLRVTLIEAIINFKALF